jgi:hypothetical protein
VAGQNFVKDIDANGGLKALVEKEIKEENTFYKGEYTKKDVECEGYKGQLVGFKNTLTYDDELVFGKQNAWIEKGMHKYFATKPIKFGINMARADNHINLENKHIDLYTCDAVRMKFDAKDKISDEMLKAALLDFLVSEYTDRLKQMTDAKIDALKKDPNGLAKWIEENVQKYIEFTYKEQQRGTTAVEQKDDGTRLADTNMATSASLIAGGNSALGEILNQEKNQEKKAEWQEKDLQFAYNQGWNMIGGVERAFVLEEICKRRQIQAFLNPLSGSDAYPQPLIWSKVVAHKTQRVYFDGFEIDADAHTASVNIYAVVETGKGKKMAFKAEHVSFHAGGLDGAIHLGMASDFTFPISNVARFTLKGSVVDAANPQAAPASGTYVKLSCANGFEGLQIDAKVQFCRKYLVPIDESTGQEVADPSVYVEASITTSIKGFHDLLVDLTVSRFAIAGHLDYKFKLSDMTLDFSDLRNPTNIAFPTDYWKGGDVNLWRGFYMESLEIELPAKLFKEKGSSQPKVAYAKKFFIDGGGMTGTVGMTNLLDKEKGTIAGWKFSVDDFNMSFKRNKPKAAAFSGQIHIPICEETEWWTYSAKILGGGEYEFSVSPKTESNINLWLAKAKLSKNSVIRIYKKDGDFVAEAALHGSLSIKNKDEDASKDAADMAGISFQDLIISTQAPYVQNAGTWSVPKVNAHIGGFKFFLDKIALRGEKEGAIQKTFLHFNLGFELAADPSKGLNIGAGGDFDLVGNTVINPQGDQKWNFEKIQINEIYLNMKSSKFSLNGKLFFFRPTANTADPINKFGRGFQGTIKLRVGGLDAGGFGIDAVGIFGRKLKVNPANPDDFFKYFLVDVMVRLPKGNGLIAGMDLTAIGGGVYWHMQRANPTGGFTFGDVNFSTLKPGQTISGCEYVPDETIGLGVRLGIGVAANPDPNSFNAEASFEMNFNAGGGINKIYLDGIAHFMQTPGSTSKVKFNPTDPSTIPEGMHANLFMYYDVASKTFQANLKLYAYLKGGYIRGCAGDDCSSKRVGDIEIYLSPKTWFINVGRTSYAKDRNADFVTLGLYTEGGKGQPAGEILIGAYFNMGHNIPAMPAIPLDLQKMFGDSYKPTDAGLGAGGKGIAFGARLQIKSSGNFLWGIGSYDVKAGAGFDFMLVNYGNTMCSCKKKGVTVNEVIGINGWYASGQLYAYVKGTATVVGIPYSVGAGALLQVQGPNPVWVKGSVVVQVAGVSKTAEFELGSQCNVVKTANPTNPLDNLQLITTLNPDKDAKNISLRAKPEINFEFPINKKVEVSELTGNYSMELKVTNLKLFNGTRDITPTQQVYSNNNTKLTLVPTEAFPANKKLRLEVTAVAYKNNTAIKTVTKTIEFETEGNWKTIPADNVLVSYPQPGVNNYYKNEDNENKGFIVLKNDQSSLLYAQNGKLELRIFKMINGVENLVEASPCTYSALDKKLNFTMPNDKLSVNGIYKLQIFLLADAPKVFGITKGKDIVAAVYTSYFRTSYYNSFFEKTSTGLVGSKTTESIGGRNVTVPHLQFSRYESLDRYELGLVKGYLPSVIITNNVNQSDWGSKVKTVYNTYPREIELSSFLKKSCKNCKFETISRDKFQIHLPSLTSAGYKINPMDYFNVFKLDNPDDALPLIEESNYRAGVYTTPTTNAKMDFDLYTTAHTDMSKISDGLWSGTSAIWEVSMNKCRNNTGKDSHSPCEAAIKPVIISNAPLSGQTLTLPNVTEFNVSYTLPAAVTDDSQLGKRPEQLLNGTLNEQVKQQMQTKSVRKISVTH